MKKILFLLLFLIALSASAEASVISVQQQSVPNWHDARTSATSPPRLRGFASASFITSEGIYIGAGTPSNSNSFFVSVTCTQSGNTVTIPTFNLYSTTDASSITRAAVYTFYWYSASGAQLSPSPYIANIAVPPTIIATQSCSPTGTCAYWNDLVLYNTPSAPPPPPQNYPTHDQVTAEILAALGGGGSPGTVTHTGALTSGDIIIGNGTADITASGVQLSNIPRLDASNVFTGTTNKFNQVFLGGTTSALTGARQSLTYNRTLAPGATTKISELALTVTDNSIVTGEEFLIASSGSAPSFTFAIVGAGQYAGTGTAGSVYGISASATNASTGGTTLGVGVLGNVANADVGTLTTGYGGRFTVQNSSTGTMGTASMGRFNLDENFGTITTLRGIDISGWSNMGTVGTSYGIYMNGSIDIGTTRYAIYSTSDSPSILGGTLQVTNLSLGVTAPTSGGQISSVLGANNITGVLLRRFTDSAPTGKFLDFQNAVGASVASLDISGNLTVASCTGCGGGGGGTVTATGTLTANKLIKGNGTTDITASKITVTDPATTATLTLANNSTFTTVGAFTHTLTFVGNTAVTFPVSGTLVTTTTTSLPNLATVGTITSGTLGGGAVLGAVTVTLGSDGSGDMYYRNGSGVLTRIAAGTSGQFLKLGGFSNPFWADVSASAGGSDTQVQYNNAGSLAGISGATSNGTSLTITSGTWNGTAVDVAHGGTGLTSGTSGGIPYFSTTTAITSSGVLSSNLPIVGGGAGAAPVSGTRSGNTTKFVTTTGTMTSGDCVKIDANGNFIANGSACGSGSPGGSDTQVQFNSTGSFAGSAALTFVSPTLSVGISSTTTGEVSFLNATNSNYIKFKAGITGSNLTFVWPTADATGGNDCLKSNESGILSFGSCSGGGGGTPGGSNGQIQFNNSGSFGGLATLTTDGTVVTQQTDTNYVLVDPSDPTKKTMFDSGGITTATTRTFTLPDFDSTSVPLGTTDDTVLVASGTVWQAKTMPDCTDTGGNHLNYTQSTNAFSCGTSGGGGGGANTALSNLASVAINTSLLPGTDNSINAGSATKRFADAYLASAIKGAGTAGTGSFLGFTSSNTPANYVQITAADATTGPAIAAVGTDTNIYLKIQGKGSYYPWATTKMQVSDAFLASQTGMLTVHDNNSANVTILALSHGASFSSGNEGRLDFTQGTTTLSRIANYYDGSDWGLKFYTNSTPALALTLDRSQGATFAGTVAITGATTMSSTLAVSGAATFRTHLVTFSALSNQPPASNYAVASTRNAEALLAFDDSTNQDAIFVSTLPAYYTANGITLVIEWAAASATSGNVVWNAAFERQQDGTDTIASDSFATAQTATCAAPGTSGIVQYCSITFSNSQIDGLLKNEAFRLKVTRNASSGSDTMTGDAQVVRVWLKETP